MLSVEKFKQYFWNISEIFLSEYTYEYIFPTQYIFPTRQIISCFNARANHARVAWGWVFKNTLEQRAAAETRKETKKVEFQSKIVTEHSQTLYK